VGAVVRVTWGKASESPGLTVRQLGGTTAHRFMGSQVRDLMERDTKVAKHRCAERSFLSRQLFCPDSRHSPLMAGRRIAAGQSFAILTPIRRVTVDRSGYPGDIDTTKGHASRRLPRRWPRPDFSAAAMIIQRAVIPYALGTAACGPSAS
jgi:hypothetical protein